MPLPVELTLADAREETFLRTGLHPSGTHNTRAKALVDSFIRQSIARLRHECEWFRLDTALLIPLVPEQCEYDVPEATSFDKIKDLRVLDPRDRQSMLLPGRTYGIERAGQHVRYDFVNNVLRLDAKPTDRFAAILIRAQLTADLPTSDFVRLPFDSEAIIRFAVAELKSHYRRSDAVVFREDAEWYLIRVKRRQAPTAVFPETWCKRGTGRDGWRNGPAIGAEA